MPKKKLVKPIELKPNELKPNDSKPLNPKPTVWKKPKIEVKVIPKKKNV